MKHHTISLIALLLLFACNQPKKPDGLTINGHFSNASGKKIYLAELQPDGITNLDSITLDTKGTFQFARKPAEPGFYLVKTQSGENILLLLNPTETVTLQADFAKNPFDYEVSGSQGSTLLKDFYTQTFTRLSKADSLANILRKMQGSPEFYQMSVQFDPLFLRIIHDQKSFEKSFIEQHDTSLASIIVLNYKFGVLPILSIEEDLGVYLRLDSTLLKKYPQNKHVLALHQAIVDYQNARKQTPGN